MTFTENLFKIASKLTGIVTILTNIALAGDHIFQVLAQYSWVLPQYLRVLIQYLRVLSRWIHPYSEDSSKLLAASLFPLSFKNSIILLSFKVSLLVLYWSIFAIFSVKLKFFLKWFVISRGKGLEFDFRLFTSYIILDL